MADTWPVNNGSVGEQSSAERIDTTDDARAARTNSSEDSPPVPPSSEGKPRVETTVIQDPTLQEVFQTIDTFLKGAAQGLGGLLSQGLSGILGQLGGVVNQLLSSTSLTSVLGGVLEQVSAGIGQAMNQMMSGISKVAGDLFRGITNDLKTALPGLGTAMGQFGNAVQQFGNGIQDAFNGLPTTLQTGISAAVAGVVADKFTNIDPGLAAGVVGAIRFNQNPVAHINEIKAAAQGLDQVLGGSLSAVGNGLNQVIRDTNNAAAQFGQVLIPTSNGFRINAAPINIDAPVFRSISGQITEVTNNNLSRDVQTVRNAANSIFRIG